jgi:outer membrane protease
MSAYLTKSNFVHALDCPTKFYYHENEEYKSKLEDDEFLQALAEGGLQVGELAKLYFIGGYDIPMTHEKSVSIKQANDLIQ